MKIQLSDHFSYAKLIRFTLPSVFMMIFISIYGMVDGYFISNIVGKTAFAAVNLIIPFLQIIGGVGAMLGVGGSALVAKTLGEGDIPRARRYFTMMLYLMLASSLFFTALGIAVLRPVSLLFGATEAMLPDCIEYGRICLLFTTALQAQYTFQSYLIVAEKPNFALFVVVAAGCTNMVLDYLLMAVFGMGVAGAAIATGLSQCVGGLLPFFWFLSKRNTSALRFAKTKFEPRPMLLACANGSSEMMTSVSASVTGVLYNMQLMRYAGEDGVAAYGVVMYAALLAMTKRAFVICALPFFVMWFNMYASSLFTALNNGAISAAISFLRSLVLPALCILTLPLVFKLDGVWYALAGSEMLSVFISLFFVLSQKKKYGY